MTRPLWTLAEIAAATGGRLEPSPHLPAPSPDAPVTGVSIDTRSLEPGDLFVPLTDQRDGHAFVGAAFERGAAAALVRVGYQRKAGDGVLIRVPDVPGRDAVLAALERLGVAARARLAPNARVIAVTGSAGKTGTKEMLRACLRVCASAPERVHAPEKSFNNHWGVPLTLARMPAETEFAVFEIGMNHAGEIRPLTKMVRPHVAIVTNVLPVHVGNFEDGIEGVARAKAEIFEGLVPGGTAIIPRDGPHHDRLAAAASLAGGRLISFGSDPRSGVHAESVETTSTGTRVLVRYAGDKRAGYTLGMVGAHLAVNSLAAIATLAVLDCDMAIAVMPLAGVASAPGRGARQTLAGEGGDLMLLDESYNANPASMAAALAGLGAVNDARRRIAVMGDMLELGGESVRYHVGLKDAVVGAADLVLCCGPNMRHLFDALPPEKRAPDGWRPSSVELVGPVLAVLRPGDAVMVKGSLGTRMAPIVEAIKKRFADGSKQG